MATKLFIICGHGAGDPGAIGNGYHEEERVRALAKRIKELGGDSVIIGDTSKDWYKSKLVNNNNIPKGVPALELHMNSWTTSSPRGACVLIDADYEADSYDKALADNICSILPGRDTKIVPRGNLANLNRAQAAGINYRFLECGFISNPEDVKIFNTRMTDIAKGILMSFGIKPMEKPADSGKLYRVQVGAFSNKANAEKLMKELKSKGYNAIIKED